MYIATFFTHYGAQTFHKIQKKRDESTELMPVPRALSAACGICVAFDADSIELIKSNLPEDLEGLYTYNDGKYKLIFESEE